MRYDLIRDLLAQQNRDLLEYKIVRRQSRIFFQPPKNRFMEHLGCARLDIRARGFWQNGQKAHIDVRVLIASSFYLPHTKKSLMSCYDKQEREKKRAYKNLVMQIKNLWRDSVFIEFGTASRERTNILRVLSIKFTKWKCRTC